MMQLGRRRTSLARALLVACAILLPLANVACEKGEPSQPGNGNGNGNDLDCDPLGAWDGTIRLNEFVFDATFTLTVDSVDNTLFSGVFSGVSSQGAFSYDVDGEVVFQDIEFTWTDLPQVGFPFVGTVDGRFELDCVGFQATFRGEDANGDPVTASVTALKRTS